MEIRTSIAGARDIDEDVYVSFRRRTTATPDEDDPVPTWFHYDVQVDQSSREELFSDKPHASITGGSLSFFLPYWILIRFDAAEQRIRKLADDICSLSTTLISAPRFGDERVSESVVKVVNSWLKDHGADPLPIDSAGTLASVVRDRLMPLIQTAGLAANPLILRRSTVDEKLAAEFALLREQLLQVMLTECVSEFELAVDSPRAIVGASEFLKDFFKLGIRYLGPLRDSPRPVYQLEALESTTNVGYRGEHTAAVLDLNSAREVSYHSPPKDLSDSEYVTSSQERKASLHDAVVEWLTYLGIADEVVTTEAGVFGNRLRVSTDSAGRLHDLTNVGVGVSQVLPIVVMALLAPPGSFLIFEQPELHLHPKVQARLADFFLALALDGKQSLLETHSEYLVDRFRLRIALSSTDSVRPLINILFSEKIASQSTLTPIEISEFGSIGNWPKDFFDQSQRDIGRIVQAASEKRRKRPSS